MTHRVGLMPGLGLAAAIFILDRLSKIWLIGLMEERGGAPLEIAPFFDLVMVWNSGASFGLLSGRGAHWFLTGLAIVILIVLLVWLWRTSDRMVSAGLGLVIGGALGNVVDRFLYNGRVADFFDIHIGGYHWPAFNIADSAICIGVAFLLWNSLFDRTATDKDGAASQGENSE